MPGAKANGCPSPGRVLREEGHARRVPVSWYQCGDMSAPKRRKRTTGAGRRKKETIEEEMERMAADPQIQAENRAIEEDFRRLALQDILRDGLGPTPPR